MLQIYAIIRGTSVMNFKKNPQHDFPKMRGGGQRPFGTFAKIHPFWKGQASLTAMRWGGQNKPGRLGGSQENPKEVHCAQQDASTTLGVQYENNNICLI